MYEFTFTIVDGVPKLDRRADLSYELNVGVVYVETPVW